MNYVLKSILPLDAFTCVILNIESNFSSFRLLKLLHLYELVFHITYYEDL